MGILFYRNMKYVCMDELMNEWNFDELIALFSVGESSCIMSHSGSSSGVCSTAGLRRQEVFSMANFFQCFFVIYFYLYNLCLSVNTFRMNTATDIKV